jgi:hypothetical protein
VWLLHCIGWLLRPLPALLWLLDLLLRRLLRLRRLLHAFIKAVALLLEQATLDL